jgi:methionyl-tRNA synthetase
VAGTCPACGSGTNGNICEQCGEPNTCADLVAPRARVGEARPRLGDVSRWTLDLAASAADIRAHQLRSRMPPRILALTDRVLAKGPRIAVSHPADWGIRPETGLAGSEDQVVWVWPEMAYGFLYGIEALGAGQGKSWDKAAPSDDWKIVHFFGFDNSFYHAILYPAIYAASLPGWTPDIDYHVNEFYLLEGEKFSTSRRHAIWGKEILTPATVDAVRLFLSLTRSEVDRTNFSLTEFDAFVETRLIGGWQGWLTGLGRVLDEDFGGIAPDAGNWSADHRAFLARLDGLRREAGQALGAQGFSLNRAARCLLDLADAAELFGLAQRHLRGIAAERDRWRTAVALELTAARLLAELAAPVAPRFSAALLAALGQSTLKAWPEAPTPVPPGTAVVLAETRFFTPASGAGPGLAPGSAAGLAAE